MEKRGKEIIFLVLAAVLVAVAAMTLFKRPSAPPVEPAAQKPREETAAKAPDKSELPTPQALLGGPPGTSPTRNPFTRPGAASQPAAVPAGQPPSPEGTPETGLPPLPPPPDGVSPLGPDLAPDVLQLTGTIRGEKSVAVLRRGDAHYFVTRGERVEGEYVVTNIGQNSVTLKTKEGKKLVLTLGGGI
jgi:hypothetical protein